MIMDGLAEKIERIEKKEGAEGEGLRIADVGTGTGYVMIHCFVLSPLVVL